jgi:hypothetical protein
MKLIGLSATFRSAGLQTPISIEQPCQYSEC